MPQGISPNPLNKISEVYLSQISEHHKKDVDGNTIPHEGEDVDEGAGLYANIHAKRKRGGKMRKKGDKGAPSSQDFANAARTAKEEIEIDEAKVDKGRSDYGKASIRNYRRMGPGHDEPGMFDPEGKRGKAIDKRREEHKARRGVKGAKVPAYKVEEVEVDEAMAMKPSNIKKKAKLGAALDRLQALKVAKKKKEMGEAFAETGMAKGSGKPSGVMKDFLDKRAKKLEKQRAAQPERYRNNPAFDSTSPNSRSTDLARTRAEDVEVREGVKGEDSVMRKMAARDRISGKEKRLNPLQAKRSVKPVYYREEDEVIVERQKDSDNQRLSQERGRSDYGKATIRNVRKFGTAGENPDPLTGEKITKDATRGELITKRREEHKAKRGIKTKVRMESLSDWREDFIWEDEVEGPDTKDQKKVVEKNIKNKIIINPKLGEAVEELGGQLIDVQEMNGSEDKKEMDPQMKSKMLRQRQLKKQVLLRKLQAVRQTGGEDIVASYEPEGEQLDEYGDPRVGVRLRVARAIDKTNPKPKIGSKRTAISNKLKMASIKAETRRRQQKENPYSAGKRMKMVATSIGDRVKQKARAMTTREDYIPEEEYDHYKDRMAERGIDISSPDKKDATTMPRKPEKPSKGMTAAQKAAKGRSALDIVKADIRKKYGKDAIMDLGKK